MAQWTLSWRGLATAGVMTAAISGLAAQSANTPVNEAPNPYTTVENHFKLPEGRTWGSTSAVDIDPTASRSGWPSAAAPTLLGPRQGDDVAAAGHPQVRRVGQAGAQLRHGDAVFPHGIHIDREGNVWVTDGQDNMPRRAPGAPPTRRCRRRRPRSIGHQVFKFSPDGKLLLTLGKPGGNQPGQPVDPASFYQPNDVITYPNGDILVAEGHGNAAPRRPARSSFDKTGKFLREFGKLGAGPQGEFMQPHGLAFDSRGRLFVADRSNNRIQILDAESYKTLDTWHQFSRLSGIFIDKNDMLYGADSESGSVNPPHYPWKRGIRIGSAKDGKVTAFIPDPTSVADLRDGGRQGRGEDGGRPPAPPARWPPRAWQSTRPATSTAPKSGRGR